MSNAAYELDRLLDVMRRLRDPEVGCPWDKVQTHATIAPFAVEEAYEVMDAISRADWAALPDELGDLLLQVVYQAQIGAEEAQFDFATVARTIADKMVRRHPHVFGDTTLDADLWERGKAQERAHRSEYGALAGIPNHLPALIQAGKYSARAARVGFDWGTPGEALDKIVEELDEVKAELDLADRDRLEDEVGDVLFTVANLARKLKLDPEACLRRANAKFARRFNDMEAHLAARGEAMADQDLEVLEALWQQVKREHRAVE